MGLFIQAPGNRPDVRRHPDCKNPARPFNDPAGVCLPCIIVLTGVAQETISETGGTSKSERSGRSRKRNHRSSGNRQGRLLAPVPIRRWLIPVGILVSDAIGAVLIAALLFAPWAFGTTQPWSIEILNATGWLLGGLFLVAKSATWLSGRREKSGWPDILLGSCTVAILLYDYLSVKNPAAAYDLMTQTLVECKYIPWLPHSYNVAASWSVFIQDLALAGTFWAARHWMSRTRHANHHQKHGMRYSGLPAARMRKLIWVLVISGFALAVVGILQRQTADGKLLWMVEPRINKAPESQFGPYAYRSNAMQYLCMLWPLGLGLWSTRRLMGDSDQEQSWPQRLLLVMSLTIAATPLISMSRAGAAVGSAGLIVAFVLILKAHWNVGKAERGRLAAAFCLAAAVGIGFGWEGLAKRFEAQGFGDESRDALREEGWQMVKDNPVFGTGPGTFAALSQFYRKDLEEGWFGQMHCDWLECFSSRGVIGMLPFLLGLGVIASRWRMGGDQQLRGTLIALALVGLVGPIVHAIADFPFQIYSIQHLFIVICAFLSLGSWRGK